MHASDLVGLTIHLLQPDARVLAEDPDVASSLRAAVPGAVVGPASALTDGPVDAVWLLAGEVARAGERGPAVIDEAVRRTRPGGLIAVAVPSRTFATLAMDGGPAEGSMTSEQLAHMLTERGGELALLAAPGAAARLSGRRWRGVADLPTDSVPGLLDAGPMILAVARTAQTPADRSRQFFASITRRIVAASVLCRDEDGRILVVFDRFKGAWTLPGGLVDAGESPVEAAVREAREEGGVDVRSGALLGVFGHPMPERVHLVYDAVPVAAVPHPVAIHDHEIGEVRWAALPQAMELLDRDAARKVRMCLDQPGGTHFW